MDEATDRLGLPLLVAGQAQKEVFHNEALALLDLAVQACVLAVGFDTPPRSPEFGQCWIVGSTPTGSWAEHAYSLAGWTQGGWRFIAPWPGMSALDQASGQLVRFDGATWSTGPLSGDRLMIDGVQVIGPRQPAVARPAGGATVDVEARAAIAAMLATLASHGLIAA